MNDPTKERQRLQRENDARIRAQRDGKAQTYIDTDGCEVTAMPDGAVFYNAADWW
jgi:hypothetical protein